MKSCAKDGRLLLGLISAHILLYITYHNTSVFWYLYTASMLFCVSIAMASEKSKDNESSLAKNIIYGLLSGILVYALFALGNALIQWLDISTLSKDVAQLYKKFSPVDAWHFLVLFLVIIPAEEIFWRGFIQKRIGQYISNKATIIASALLYALPLIYSQNLALIIAGIAAGAVWAALYQWKKSLPLVIMSHLIFDYLLLVLLPFK
ncbi:MAG: lysostaphin resistance A-like protein [Bacillus sp. (in: firmicutes)]